METGCRRLGCGCQQFWREQDSVLGMALGAGQRLGGDRRGHAERRESETHLVVKSALNLQKFLGGIVLACKRNFWAESIALGWSVCCLPSVCEALDLTSPCLRTESNKPACLSWTAPSPLS